MAKGLEIVHGKTGDFALEHELADRLRKESIDGTMYIGYPIFASGDGHLQFDILLSSKNSGFAIIDTSHFRSHRTSIDSMRKRQNRLYNVLTAKMRENTKLCNGRNLIAEPLVVSLHENINEKYDDGTIITTFDEINKILKSDFCISDDSYELLNAFIQNTSALRPKKKRLSVKNSNSYGARMKLIEQKIANLDTYQNKAALEVFDGLQRIRGLAGSGKTIVLAIKAANLHKNHPDWRILITFYTRSLNQQFKYLVRAFSTEEPDWSKITILHSWGSSIATGVYYEICKNLHHRSMNFTDARNKFGANKAFKGACSQLLQHQEIPKLYDAALIDEAQDLPQDFFKLIFRATKNPKRIVYAYDELQSLNNMEILPPEELFGRDQNEKPRVSLKEAQGQPKQDFVLPVCYRNPPWILTAALTLGFGIHKQDGIVQMFKERNYWREVGYESVGGKIDYGHNVHIRRKKSSSPNYFEELIDIESSILFDSFEAREYERHHIYNDIKKNIETNELDPDDILVIIANPYNVQEEFDGFSKLFAEDDIGVHAPGIISSYENIFEHNSIAVTTMYRAKGNEAPVVYLVGAEYCASLVEPHTRRNFLFTALTRSKGWIRVSGVGDQMRNLTKEFSKLKQDNFSLKFKYPTEFELEQIRTLNNDKNEKRKIQTDILYKLLNGQISSADVPEPMKTEILNSYDQAGV